MKRRWVQALMLLLIFTAMLTTVVWVTADGGLSIGWYSLDGGGQSSGGDFRLSGAIGQPDAHDLLAGGVYELRGGFWAGIAERDHTVYIPLIQLP